MTRAIIVLLLMVISAGAGAWLPSFIKGATARGGNLQCIHGDRICVGQRYEDALNIYNLDKMLGGIVALTCGFEEPGHASERNPMLFLSGIPKGCASNRSVVSLNDGNIMTNFWLDQGAIVRIDQYGANPFDP